jgi:glutamyl-tRNA synthetase
MAIISLMARLGSSDPVELRMSLDEGVEGFELSHFGSAPTKFDAEDLKPLTARVLSETPHEVVADHLNAAGVPAHLHAPFWQTIRDNIGTMSEVGDWWTVFSDGAVAMVGPEDAEFVESALGLLPDPPYDAGTWTAWTDAVKAATGRKGRTLFMPLRLAVTGRATGPEMADVMPLLQKKPRVNQSLG